MIESIKLLWFIAFAIDLALGIICFLCVASGKLKSQYQSFGWWVGWWSFLDAFSLALNAAMGTDYFWSYHQTGIITDTAVNVGLLIYIIKVSLQNWALNEKDWDKIDAIRNEAKVRELSK